MNFISDFLWYLKFGDKCIVCEKKILNQEETPHIVLQEDFGDERNGYLCDDCGKTKRNSKGELISYIWLGKEIEFW